MDIYEGQNMYIRTVTYARVGTVVAVGPREIYLHPCVDIVETGAFTSFFGLKKKGKIKSSEPVRTSKDRPAMISRAAITDAAPWWEDIPETPWDDDGNPR